MAVLIVLVSLTKTFSDYTSKIKSTALHDKDNGKEYNWVTVVPDSILFVLFNGAMLSWQVCRGQVKRDQFDYIFRCSWTTWKELGAWKYLVLAGVNDVADNLTGLAAQPHLTTFMYSLSNQSTAAFTACISMVLIGTRYTAQEVGALTSVIAVAVLGVITGAKNDAANNNLGWALFASATTSFAALGFVLKEIMFTEFKRFRGRPQEDETITGSAVERNNVALVCRDSSTSDQTLSVFVVATGVSLVSLCVAVPMALAQEALLVEGGFPQAWIDLQDGLHLLFYGQNILVAYAVYLVCNMAFSLALLFLTNYGSALVAFLSLKLAVPMIALLSPLPWPLIGPTPVSSTMWFILFFMLAAISVFRFGTIKREELKVNTCCWPLISGTIHSSQTLGTSLCEEDTS